MSGGVPADTGGNRAALSLVRNNAEMAALYAVRPVAAEYGLPTEELKPCVALLLDGNTGSSARHEAAFVIAIECRRIGCSQDQTQRVLVRWAKKISYRQTDVRRASIGAFRKKPDGRWQYYPPGVSKKPGQVYERVLSATCATLVARQTARRSPTSTADLAARASRGSKSSDGLPTSEKAGATPLLTGTALSRELEREGLRGRVASTHELQRSVPVVRTRL